MNIKYLTIRENKYSNRKTKLFQINLLLYFSDLYYDFSGTNLNCSLKYYGYLKD